jgi:spoIIIJ-associated protein
MAQEITRCMHLQVKATAELNDEGIRLVFEGRDVDLLLQRNAAVLYAVEYLLNRIFAGRLDKDKKVTADAGDFRSLRQEELRLMAIKASEKVITYGRPVDLQPMPPHERRIIHLALQDQPKVKTVSEGFGESRKVVIVPA